MAKNRDDEAPQQQPTNPSGPPPQPQLGPPAAPKQSAEELARERDALREELDRTRRERDEERHQRGDAPAGQRRLLGDTPLTPSSPSATAAQVQGHLMACADAAEGRSDVGAGLEAVKSILELGLAHATADGVYGAAFKTQAGTDGVLARRCRDLAARCGATLDPARLRGTHEGAGLPAGAAGVAAGATPWGDIIDFVAEMIKRFIERRNPPA